MSPTMPMPIFWSRIFCSSSGSDTFCIVTISSFRPSFSNDGARRLLQGLGERDLVGGEVEERRAARADGVGDVLQHQAAQLAVELLGRVALARARDLVVEEARIGDAVGVVAEGAQAHGAEVLVADRHRLARAPALVDLLARREEVDVALERAPEELVPVLQVGEDRQRRRRQRVAARAEDVGDLAFVDEHRDLRFAHRERAAVLDLAVFHRDSARRACRRCPPSTR